MKISVLILSLVFSLTAFASNTVSTIKNKKTGDELKISCLDQDCAVVEINLHQKAGKVEMLSRLTQEELAIKLTALTKKNKVRFKDHFFLLTQGLAKLPWDSEEFVLFYTMLAPLTVPLTIGAVGFDVAVLPLSVSSVTIDIFDGNIGRKAQRKIKKKKSFKLKDENFSKLAYSLKAL